MMNGAGAQRPGSEFGDMRHIAWPLAGALALLGLLQVAGPAWRDALRFERAAVLAGQWWRLLTAHLVHADPRHLAYNAAGLVLLWLLFAREWPLRRWAVIVAAAVVAIDAGLWWQRPAVQWYLGSSGVLHGLWAAGAWRSWRREGARGALPLVALLLKLAVEQLRGGSLVVGGMPVLLMAHVYGALGGGLAALDWRGRGSKAARPL